MARRTFVNRCLELQPDTDDLLELTDEPNRLVVATVKLTLRNLARRWKALDAEVKTLSRHIEAIVTQVAPALSTVSA